jgi:hypothetical protein
MNKKSQNKHKERNTKNKNWNQKYKPKMPYEKLMKQEVGSLKT